MQFQLRAVILPKQGNRLWIIKLVSYRLILAAITLPSCLLHPSGVDAGFCQRAILKPDESHKKGCKREAFEEAGIKGRILTDFPMTHVVTKSDNGTVSQVAVTYYPMLVSKQFDEWPEQPKRERHWALLDDAPRVTDREDFRLVINQFAAIKPLILKTAKHKKA